MKANRAIVGGFNIAPEFARSMQRVLRRLLVTHRAAKRGMLGSIVFLLFLLPAAVQAQFLYTTNNGTLTITGYTGPGGVVIIPDTIDTRPVVAIGNHAFEGCTTLLSVTLPNSAISIGAWAFADCTNLTTIIIPNSVTTIGAEAFEFCTSLSTATLPSSLTSIEGDTFSYCTSLTSVTVPTGVIKIGTGAFSWCKSLTHIAISGSATNIGDYAFDHCTNLVSVTINDGVTSIGGGAFYYCTRLAKVALPNSVTRIGTSAFQSCASLSSVTVGNGVTIVGDYAFGSCISLTEVYFRGNAPIFNWAIFPDDYNVTVFYLPGTTGWGTTFSSRPTAPWHLPNPQILDFGPSFGVKTNRFGFIISWATNASVVVEAATNLATPSWSPVATNTLTGGSSYFSDPEWTNHPARFYRLRSP